jgi:hypothetical protein
MSMSGAKATAPPIFYLYWRYIRGQTWQPAGKKLRSISCKSPGVVEDFREKNMPYRAFVRHGCPLHPGRDPLRSECACGGCSRGGFTSEKEKQIQNPQIQNQEE